MKYSSYYITGATGFLGRAVLTELLSRGGVVHAFVMNGDPFIGEIENDTLLHYGDITDYASVEDFPEQITQAVSFTPPAWSPLQRVRERSSTASMWRGRRTS